MVAYGGLLAGEALPNGAIRRGHLLVSGEFDALLGGGVRGQSFQAAVYHPHLLEEVRSMNMGRLAILSLGLMVLAACGSNPGTSNKADIHLLLEGPLTGSSADIGIEQCNGAKLAAHDINSAGGISKGSEQGAKIVIDCADNPSFSTDVATTLATRFASDQNTWTMIGFGGSGEALAAAKVAQKYSLIVTTSGGAADFLSDQASNVGALLPRSSTFGAAWVDFCHTYFGANNVAVLTGDYSYVVPYLDGAMRESQQLGVPILDIEKYQPGIQDYSPYLTKIKAKNPQCLLLNEYTVGEAQQVVQARRLGFKVPMVDFGTGGPEPSTLQAGGNDLLGYVWGVFLAPKAASGSLLEKVSAEYASTYPNLVMGYYSAFSYDSVQAVRYAIEAGASKREDLGTYLQKVDAPGVSGQISFDSKLRIKDRPLYLLEQTGTSMSNMDLVAQYDLKSDGSVSRTSIQTCSSRPTCQLNLYK